MDQKLIDQLNDFIDHFELVFDNDWDTTKARIKAAREFGCEGSFLVTDTYDESNNWANRGSLLSSYRELVSLMVKRRIRKSTFPDIP